MIDSDWHPAMEKKPWPLVAVHVLMGDGRQGEAIWTGHIWWGESRELEVLAWRPVELDKMAA
jgi:hypothetical protein